ncbi:BppU family phage baseplate upper protein, partial [Periweissella ghanensis]
FDEMSGDVGDAGRTVYLAIKERAVSNDPKSPLKPMDMTGMDVRFQGHDAYGVFKRIALSTKIDNAQAGLVQITLPRFIYQAVGPYEDGEFEVYETKGDTVISTIPVAFEVYNNHAHMTTGDSQVYSDEFEKLMHDFEVSSSNKIDDFNARMKELVQQISTANNSVDALKQLVATWTKLVEEKSVAILSADNIFTGDMRVKGTATFDKPLKGYTTGNSVQYFSSDQPQQDLNSVENIKSMPAMTRSSAYYTDNRVKNNPLDS